MSISDLPIEVWQEVLINLSFIDLMNSRLVCKNFHNLTIGDYFMKHYPYAIVIDKASNWKQQKDGYKINTKDNNLKIHLMGLCIQHQDFDLFDRLLHNIRNQSKGFRMNWIDIYYYAGLGGSIKSFEYLKKINIYRQSHGDSCMKGAMENGHLELIKYLKNNMNISLHFGSYKIQQLIKNNKIELIKYLYNINPHIFDEVNYYHLDSTVKSLLQNRSLELINLILNINSNDVKYRIIRKAGFDIEIIKWLIDNKILNMEDRYILDTIKKTTFTLTLILYTKNDIIDKNTIDWNQQLINLIMDSYCRKTKLYYLLEFIVVDLQININTIQLYATAMNNKYGIEFENLCDKLNIEINYKDLFDYIFAHNIIVDYKYIKHIYNHINWDKIK